MFRVRSFRPLLKTRTPSSARSTPFRTANRMRRHHSSNRPTTPHEHANPAMIHEAHKRSCRLTRRFSKSSGTTRLHEHPNRTPMSQQPIKAPGNGSTAGLHTFYTCVLEQTSSINGDQVRCLHLWPVAQHAATRPSTMACLPSLLMIYVLHNRRTVLVWYMQAPFLHRSTYRATK